MDYFEMAADLPRKDYCKRQQEGGVCQTRVQCIHCQLYSEGLLPAHYPVPSIHVDTFTVTYVLCLIEDFWRRELDAFADMDQGS